MLRFIINVGRKLKVGVLNLQTFFLSIDLMPLLCLILHKKGHTGRSLAKLPLNPPPPPTLPKPVLIKIGPVGLEHKLKTYESLQRFGRTETHEYKK